MIAPGDESFYDKQFFLGGAQTFRFKNKIYELVGGLVSAFNWQKAEKFARLLGGELAAFEDEKEMMKDYSRQVNLAVQYAKKVFGEDFPPY